MKEWTVSSLAERLGGEVIGDPATRITGIAMADAITPGAVTYAMSREYLTRVEASPAAAAIVGTDVTTSNKPLIRVAAPKVAFARALELFFPRATPEPGRHPTAVVAADATVDETATLGPHVVVERGARVGARTVLHAGVLVGAGCVIGADCELFGHVVIYERVTIGDRVRIHAGTVVGADGFGYVLDEGVHRKIPQVGTVDIGDDVELGACVCVDRGTLGATRIGRGARIDNFVQIGHNVDIGDHAVLVAQVGISGSTTVGPYATLAGQAGVSDHLTIGPAAVVGAASKVLRNVQAGEVVFGYPARPATVAKRQLGALSRLPNALARLRRLEKALDQLRGELGLSTAAPGAEPD